MHTILIFISTVVSYNQIDEANPARNLEDCEQSGMFI